MQKKKSFWIILIITVGIVMFFLGIAVHTVYVTSIVPENNKKEAIIVYNKNDWNSVGYDQESFIKYYNISKYEYELDPIEFQETYGASSLDEYWDNEFKSCQEMAAEENAPNDDVENTEPNTDDVENTEPNTDDVENTEPIADDTDVPKP